MKSTSSTLRRTALILVMGCSAAWAEDPGQMESKQEPMPPIAEQADQALVETAVEEIPEPTFAALLGLGATLALLMRRRQS